MAAAAVPVAAVAATVKVGFVAEHAAEGDSTPVEVAAARQAAVAQKSCVER